MIPPNDLKAGNWISLNYSGSLLEANKILEIDKYGVVIEKGTTNTLIKVGNKWEYPEVPQKKLIYFKDIKGIPLITEILDSCGFKLNYKTTLTLQPGTEDSIIKYFSDKHAFTLKHIAGASNIFTHESSNSNIEFVHQLQNLYQDFMNRELDITIPPYNFQLLMH